jgi:MYND finger
MEKVAFIRLKTLTAQHVRYAHTIQKLKLLCERVPRLRQKCAGSLECKKRKNLFACGRCKHALYCSVQCQQAHWRIHKGSCAALQ